MSVFLLILTLFLSLPSYGQSFILMEVGEKKRILSHPSETIRMSRPGIIKIRETSKAIILKAIREGTLSLDHGSKTKIIKVLSQGHKKRYVEWTNVISQTPWLYWSFDQSGMKVAGHLYFFKTWKKLADISKKYQIPYQMEATISSSVQKQITQFFKTKIQNPLFQIKWQSPVMAFVPSYIHHGLFSDFGIKAKADESLFPEPLIDIHLLISEVSQSVSSIFNIQSQLSFPRISLQSIIENLSLAQNKGKGHIIASTKILIQNKKTGNFNMGGEVPFHKYNNKTFQQSTHWKPYGFSIKISPTLQNQNVVELDLSISISEIDHSQSTQNSPATKNHAFSTKIQVPMNKTLCLSHLERDQSGRAKKALGGWLSTLTGVSLFDRGSVQEKTEAMIFITPTIHHL